MVDEMQLLIGLLSTVEPSASSSDTIALVLLGTVVLFFAWLVIAVIRKLTGKNKIADFREDEAEAQRTARLWAEAKRRAEDEEDEEEGDKADIEEQPAVDLQTELLQKAQERREAQTDDRASREARQKAFRDIDVEQELTPAIQPITPSRSDAQEQEQTQPQASQPESAQQSEQPTEQSDQTVKPEPTSDQREAEPSKPRAVKSLEEGLTKTRAGFISKLTGMFGRPTLDEDELEEIEEILFTADIGVRTAQKLVDFIQNEVSRKDKSDPAKLVGSLRDKICSMLAFEVSALDLANHKPYVILVVGVNGTGKTTTIGKLAMRHTNQGRKVVLAAADTFRAAASEQLEIWGKRAGAQVIRGQEGGDPGAVVFDAINAAKSQSADIVIADTAGRLHTKINLVEELRKIQRVCGKALSGAPHEVWLVLDATTGQNAINQAKQFHKALDLTGIVLTKLDGTAKGGVIIGITDTFGIPVRYIGIGEQAEDLRPFSADAFVKALFT